MNRLRWVPLALFALLPGCVIAVGNTAAPQGGYFVPGPATPLSAELDAAGSLQFENNRKEQLLAIAQRPGIQGVDQVHLVNVAMAHLDFENSRKEVLLALIANPSFNLDGKNTILHFIPKFSFDNDRVALLEAMRNRPLPAAPLPVPPAQ